MKSPIGGVGENEAAESKRQEKAGFSNFASQGVRAKGVIIATQAELTGDAVPLKPVFEAFMPLLKFHGIYSMEAFHHRVKHCKTTPSRWVMLFLDKVHAIYRDRGGTTLLEDDDADPVAMTVAGLVPKKGGHLHQPTEAARQLFLEVMLDYAKAQKGERSRWAGCLSAPSITLELDRRKGKAGKIVS
jgi:hypothetical protein